MKNLEVNQVWEGTHKLATRKILGFQDNGDVIYHWRNTQGDGVGVGTPEAFVECCVLIENADGTPVHQWENIGPYHMNALLTKGAKIPARVRDREDEPWVEQTIRYVDLFEECKMFFFDDEMSPWAYCQIEVKKE